MNERVTWKSSTLFFQYVVILFYFFCLKGSKTITYKKMFLFPRKWPLDLKQQLISDPDRKPIRWNRWGSLMASVLCILSCRMSFYLDVTLKIKTKLTPVGWIPLAIPLALFEDLFPNPSGEWRRGGKNTRCCVRTSFQ